MKTDIIFIKHEISPLENQLFKSYIWKKKYYTIET